MLQMTPDEVLRISPVLPVVVVDDADDAVPTARALARGRDRRGRGHPPHAAALEAVRRIALDVPEVLVGVGTVTRAQDVSAALEAGARFLVTPGATDALLTEVAGPGCRSFRGPPP